MTTATTDISWPDFTFPPINLWNVTSAYWFYLSAEEKTKEFLTVREEYLI